MDTDSRTARRPGSRGVHPAAALLLLTAIAGCGKGAVEFRQDGEPMRPIQLTTTQEVELRADYGRERRAKDLNFASDAESPLAREYRLGFQGLAYYPVDARYRFRGPIHRVPGAQKLRIMSTTGELREAIHWGYFRFAPEGQEMQTLQVYKMTELEPKHSKLLFLPFADSQAGRETYGAGRYLDLEESEDGIYTIDFNAAYNPYCAYGKPYSCPITPRENRLKIPIRAGEKNFPPPAGRAISATGRKRAHLRSSGITGRGRVRGRALQSAGGSGNPSG